MQNPRCYFWRETCGRKLNSNGGNIRFTVAVIHLESKTIRARRIHVPCKAIQTRAGIKRTDCAFSGLGHYRIGQAVPVDIPSTQSAGDRGTFQCNQ